MTRFDLHSDAIRGQRLRSGRCRRRCRSLPVHRDAETQTPVKAVEEDPFLGQQLPHVPLADEDDENEEACQYVDDVRRNPNVLFGDTSHHEGDDLHHPRHAHQNENAEHHAKPDTNANLMKSHTDIIHCYSFTSVFSHTHKLVTHMSFKTHLNIHS